MIFCLGLFEMKLLELLDLEELSQQHEQAILLDLTITQKNLATANERIRVGSFPGCLKASLQLSLHHSFRAAGIFNNLLGRHVVKLHARSEWGILRFRLHREIAVNVAASNACGNLRKLQIGRASW